MGDVVYRSTEAKSRTARQDDLSKRKKEGRKGRRRRRGKSGKPRLLSTTQTKDQMKSRLLLNVVVRQRSAILELLPSEDKSLLIRGDTLLILDLRLDIINRVARLDFQRDRLARQGLDEDLHTTTKTEDEMEGGLFLDVVVRESSPVLELLAGEDEALLIGRDAFFVLDLRFDVVDGITGFDFQGDGLSGEPEQERTHLETEIRRELVRKVNSRLDENLHATTETKNQVKGRLLLNVVVGQRSAILQLLPSENEALLVRRDSLLILDLGLDIVDGVARLDLECDGLPSERLHKDLHTTTETEDEMESGFLLDVVVGEGAAIFELLAGEDKTLLVWGNAFLILDLGLDVIDGVTRFNLEGDRLASEAVIKRKNVMSNQLGIVKRPPKQHSRLDKDLHATTQTKDEMEGRLLLDVIIRKGAPVLELLAGEDEALLIRRDALLVLDLRLDVVDRVARFGLRG